LETNPDNSWPNSGEIDILEGVNLQSGNKATLHTNAGCSFDGSSCLGNLGCSKPAGGSNSYGDGFNANNGGVYALEWTNSRLDIWFFGRGSEPEDVLGDTPDPSQWGTPITTFAGGNGCDIDSHFQNQNIVFDTTFCGKATLVGGHGIRLTREQGIGLGVYFPRIVHVPPKRQAVQIM
jgi:hypothetical protein